MEKIRQHVATAVSKKGSIGALFDEIDTDSSGFIEFAEFECALCSMGVLTESVEPKTVVYLLDAIDFDSDGRISCRDFELFMQLGATGLAPALGLQFMRFLDTQQDAQAECDEYES